MIDSHLFLCCGRRDLSPSFYSVFTQYSTIFFMSFDETYAIHFPSFYSSLNCIKQNQAHVNSDGSQSLSHESHESESQFQQVTLLHGHHHHTTILSGDSRPRNAAYQRQFGLPAPRTHHQVDLLRGNRRPPLGLSR